jgi:hypothetical protein
MWFFKKDKETKAKTLKEQKAQELLSIMRTARAEIGEENLQAIVTKLKLDDLKKKVQADIENDSRKRDKLLDAIRYEMTDSKTTKH